MASGHLRGAYEAPPTNTNKVSKSRQNLGGRGRQEFSKCRTHLQTWSGRELFVRKKLFGLIPGLDLVCLIVALCSENLGDSLVIPGLNVVVCFIPSMDIPFNGISFIADDKTGMFISKNIPPVLMWPSALT